MQISITSSSHEITQKSYFSYPCNFEPPTQYCLCLVKMASANSKAMSLSPPKSVPFGKIDEDGGNTLSPLSSNPNSRKNSTIHQFHPPVQHHIVPTEKCGLLNVYVQVSFVHFFCHLSSIRCIISGLKSSHHDI